MQFLKNSSRGGRDEGGERSLTDIPVSQNPKGEHMKERNIESDLFIT